MIISRFKGLSEAQITAKIDASPYNIDLLGESWVEDSNNIAYTEHKDLMLFERVNKNKYEVHYFIENTGKKGFEFAVNAINFVFDTFNPNILFGYIASDNKKAKIFSCHLGASKIAVIPMYGNTADLYALNRANWRHKNGNFKAKSSPS